MKVLCRISHQPIYDYFLLMLKPKLLKYTSDFSGNRDFDIVCKKWRITAVMRVMYSSLRNNQQFHGHTSSISQTT